MNAAVPKTIDEHIKGFPEDIQKLLQQIREAIQQEVPEATEAIAYGIPTFKLKGKNMVHFAGYKTHIGFYPAPRALEKFREELAQYEGSKGTVKLPLDKPIPVDLIKGITRYRAEEILGGAR